MKKAMVLITTAALAVTLAGCASSEPKASEPSNGEKTQAVVEKSAQSDNYFTNNAPDSPQPYIAEGGWTHMESAGGNWVNYALILKNTDDVNCYTMMSIKVTAKAADGTVVASCPATAMFIAPGDVMPVVGVIPDCKDKPASIDFDISFNAGQRPGHNYTLSDLAISNTAEIAGDSATRWTGEVTNNTGVDFPNGSVPCVVLRDGGKIVGGFSDNLDTFALANGGTNAFEVTGIIGSVPEHDSFDIYSIPNLLF